MIADDVRNQQLESNRTHVVNAHTNWQSSSCDSLVSAQSAALSHLVRPLAEFIYDAVDRCVAARLAGNGVHQPLYPRKVDTRVPATKPIAEIVDDLLLAKEQDGLSKRYIETIRSHLVRFAKGMNEGVESITTPTIEHWLREQKVGPRARNNMRASVVTLFHFARKNGYLPKGMPTEADEVGKAKDRGGKIGILTPGELSTVLDRASGQTQLFLVIGAFTGMRSSEILSLDWSEVNFERSFITVSAEKAKTATRRLVPILPNLMEWLSPFRGSIGTLLGGRRDANRAIAFAKTCKVAWPNNALRHSYATYRLAVTANAERVALEMGNSPRKLMTNYRELSDETEAAAWFSIVPRKLENVISV